MPGESNLATGAAADGHARRGAGAVAVPGSAVKAPQIDALLQAIVDCGEVGRCKPETAAWVRENGGLIQENDLGLLIDKASEIETESGHHEFLHGVAEQELSEVRLELARLQRVKQLVEPGLIASLRAPRKADDAGVDVVVSRKSLETAVDILSRLL